MELLIFVSTAWKIHCKRIVCLNACACVVTENANANAFGFSAKTNTAIQNSRIIRTKSIQQRQQPMHLHCLLFHGTFTVQCTIPWYIKFILYQVLNLITIFVCFLSLLSLSGSLIHSLIIMFKHCMSIASQKLTHTLNQHFPDRCKRIFQAQASCWIYDKDQHAHSHIITVYKAVCKFSCSIFLLGAHVFLVGFAHSRRHCLCSPFALISHCNEFVRVLFIFRVYRKYAQTFGTANSKFRMCTVFLD